MELEVGMYVRTKDGEIGKITHIETETFSTPAYTLDIFPQGIYKGCEWFEGKASNKIKDLLQVGDIIKFDITDTDNYAEIQGYNCWEISCTEELNGVKEMIAMESAKLLSIVTKEQFESMSYKVEK